MHIFISSPVGQINFVSKLLLKKALKRTTNGQLIGKVVSLVPEIYAGRNTVFSKLNYVHFTALSLIYQSNRDII